MRRQQHSVPTKRRTTLTLPSDTLEQAARIARSRNVNVSVIVAEALREGLRSHANAGRGEEILGAYRRSFAGLTDEEMMILDGIIPESAVKRR